MKVKIKEKFEKITKDAISMLEKELNFTFSKEYYDFLLKYNGGFPDPNIFRTKNNEYETDLKVFYGITENNVFDLRSIHNIIIGRIPINTISIGGDSLGNHVLLDSEGKLFFYDHETDDVYFIIESFLKFLKSFYSYPEEEPTEIDIAIQRQNVGFFKSKMEEGESIHSIKNEVGRTITELAAAGNKKKLLKFCIENGADIGGSLLLAASNNHVDIIKYLLSKDADIDIHDTLNEDTPLIQACLFGNFEAAKLLIESGANVHLKDKYGNDALNKAYRSGNDTLIAFMEALSENID